MRVVRVAVADDDPDYREALVEVLNTDARFTVVGVAGTGEELVRVARRCRPDLVVLDVRMPGGGPVAARALREAFAGWATSAPVVVALTAQSASSTVMAMLREGAGGYLVKGQGDVELLDLLARTAAGEVVLAVPGAAAALRHLLGPIP